MSKTNGRGAVAASVSAGINPSKATSRRQRAPAKPGPDRAVWIVLGGAVGFLILAHLLGSWMLLVAPVGAAVVYGSIRLGKHLAAVADRDAATAARADAQHRQIMEGDAGGVFGQYPPSC